MMIVLGLFAIAYPVFATLAVDLYLGWLFLFSGLFALVAAFSTRQFRGSGGRWSRRSCPSWSEPC
jgi:uncharacterized membrane protein HdeD (DUF308 family)